MRYSVLSVVCQVPVYNMLTKCYCNQILLSVESVWCAPVLRASSCPESTAKSSVGHQCIVCSPNPNTMDSS